MPCIAVGNDGSSDEEGPEQDVGPGSEAEQQRLSSSAPQTIHRVAEPSGAPSAQAAACSVTLDCVSPEPAPPLKPRVRVIFLDIDGVLNTRPDPRILNVEGAPCVMLRRLLSAVPAPGAEVVLTTQWRKHSQYIAQVFQNFGVFEGEDELGDGKATELQRAPLHGDSTRKDLEILQWLGGRRDVTDWVVLDAADLLQRPSAQRLQGHTVRVCPSVGLAAADIRTALEILGCPERRSLPAPAAPPLEKAMASAMAWDGSLASKMEDLLANLSGRPVPARQSTPERKASPEIAADSAPAAPSSLADLLANLPTSDPRPLPAEKIAEANAEFDAMKADAVRRFG